MYYKVKIKKLTNKALGGPKTGQQTSGGALAVQPTAMGGSDIDQYIGKPGTEVTKSLTSVPRDQANLEAEGGETAYGDINGDGMLEHYNIEGPRHNSGGVPLDLPDNSFIFSDFNQMKIKDPKLLKQFGKATDKTKKSKGYTPAELAKQYDINKYRKILQNPDSDSLDKKTAELMIKNYNMKLGALAIAQESKKAFPQGIPDVAKPFMEANGISEEQIIPKKPEPPQQMPSGEAIAMPEEMPQEMMPPMAAYGMEMGGFNFPYAQEGFIMHDPYNRPQEEIDRDNDAFYERTKNLTYPKSIDKAKGQKFVSHMNQAIEAGYEHEPWFNMGMKPGQLQKYYDQFDESGNWIAPHGPRTWQPPKAQKGGEPYPESEGYSPEGVERLNMYRRMYGLPQLKGTVSKEDIKKAAGELQEKITEVNPELVVDYMSRVSHKPNNELIKIMKAKELNYPLTTEGVREAFEAGDLSADEIRRAYKDKLWWYRALETNRKKLSKEEYEKKMQEEGAIKQGDKLYFQDDPDNPQLYTEYYTEDEEPVTTTTEEEVEDQEGERPEITTPEFAQTPAAVAPEWMTPDLMNYFGALGDRFRLKKYYPWAPRYEPEVPRPVFLDPTRELAAQSEQANILTQGLGQFVGPQALSARASSIQGQGAKQAADTLSRYNNANVQIANEFAMNAANIRNQAQQQNQAIAKQLYDQTTFTNQQYDNSVMLANQAKRQAFATGWKNASDLAAVNATSDQYDIDPRTGAVVFTGGKQHTPETSKDFNYWLDYYKTTYGMNDKDAIAAAKSAMGSNPSYYGPSAEDVMEGMAKKGMIVMGPMTFPFIL